MTKARDLANASTALSAVSATELGYLDGVTSAVQTQLDNKVDETGGSVISANSSGNALEIRQTGAGKALVIEDEANPDSTPFVVAADGKVGIGVSNPTGQPLEIGSGSFGARITRYSATSYAGSGIDLRKSSSGTVGTDAAVASGDRLGRVLYSGYDGTSYVSPTEIGSDVDGTVSTGVVPSRLYFATASTAGTVTERMRVDSAGNVGIGTTSPTAKLDVNGSIKSDNLSGQNFLINGGFDIWQRGTSVSVAAASAPYTADRWQALAQTGQASTVSRQLTNDATNLPHIKYCARVQRNSGQTGTGDGLGIFNAFESLNSQQFAGRTVTFSFYARAGANFSASGNVLKARVYSGTGTDENVIFGYSGLGFPVDVSPVLTTTWQRFTYTAAIPTTVNEVQIGTYYVPTGTAGANDYFEVTGVQLEVGSVATPFSRAGGTIQGELAACQRYFYRYNAAATTGPVGVGNYYSSTLFVVGLPMKQTMRTTPSATFNNPTNFSVYSNGGSRAATAITTDIANADLFSMSVTTSAATAGNAGAMNAVQTNASIDFSSEL